MKFAMFPMGEYIALVTMSALMATLFMGGWDVPFTTWDDGDPSVLKTLVTLSAFVFKTFAFIFTIIWIRWSLPRFRFDQLMGLGWKVLLPTALGYLMVIACGIWALESFGIEQGPLYGLILFGLNLPFLVLMFGVLDSGRLITGQHQRRKAAN